LTAEGCWQISLSQHVW